MTSILVKPNDEMIPTPDTTTSEVAGSEKASMLSRKKKRITPLQAEDVQISNKRRRKTADKAVPADTTNRYSKATKILKRIDRDMGSLSQLLGPTDKLQDAAMVLEPEQVRCKVKGSELLSDILRKYQEAFWKELEDFFQNRHALLSANKFYLPLIEMYGVPINIDQMTQSGLRKLIPLMMKFSTRRGKPQWGKPESMPVWWPEEVPYCNIRVDSRTEEEKLRLPWTKALKAIVINCYKFHDREDLLWPDSQESSEVEDSKGGEAQETLEAVNSLPAEFVFEPFLSSTSNGDPVLQVEDPLNDAENNNIDFIQASNNSADNNTSFNETFNYSDNDSITLNQTNYIIAIPSFLITTAECVSDGNAEFNLETPVCIEGESFN